MNTVQVQLISQRESTGKIKPHARFAIRFEIERARIRFSDSSKRLEESASKAVAL